MPLVQNKSLTAKGIPDNFLLKSGLASKFLAFLRAFSKLSVIYVFSFFDLSDLSINVFVASDDEISFFFIFSTNSFKLRSIILVITLQP